ncbi:hypothetical protein CEXT_470881 [Caerostris extrusa]|uniref:Uncharacterized protein n=1 Tax=Caerostris extrusa TaxID=172846 RepID=A0AAV4R1H2_CAEEX|nr:hypothetical protein CEXT_470881 [Caerostris extrusa]
MSAYEIRSLALWVFLNSPNPSGLLNYFGADITHFLHELYCCFRRGKDDVPHDDDVETVESWVHSSVFLNNRN